MGADEMSSERQQEVILQNQKRDNSISRRNFLGFTAASVAALLCKSVCGKSEAPEKAEDKGFTLVDDGDGFEKYQGLNGSAVTVIYTNHDDAFDVERIPSDATALILDRGGKNFQSKNAGFVGKNAPSHFQPLADYLEESQVPCHFMAPAALGSGHNEEGGRFGCSQYIDYAVAGTQAAFGGLLLKDAYREADSVKRYRTGEEIPQSDTRSMLKKIIGIGKKDVVPDAGKGLSKSLGIPFIQSVAGSFLTFPAIAAIVRSADMNIDGKGRKWSAEFLRGQMNSNPQFLFLMNQFIDAVLVAKLRLYLLDQARSNPDNPQHFVCLYGGSHVSIGTAIREPLSELLDDLQHWFFKQVISMYGINDAFTVASSSSSKYIPFQVTGDHCIYPDLFKLLTPEQRGDVLQRFPILREESCKVVRANPEENDDISKLIAQSSSNSQP